MAQRKTEIVMLGESIVVRQANVDDVPFLRAMMREGLLASPTFLAHQQMDVLEQAEEEEWQRWQKQPDPAFVAIDATGRKVGAIRLRPHLSAAGQGWQIGMGVEADVRYQGIGRHLVEQAITYARATQASYLNLIVDPTNLPAIALYYRTGFVEIGERDFVIEMRLLLSEQA